MAQPMTRGACKRAFFRNEPMPLQSIACAWEGVPGWSLRTLRRLIVESRVAPVDHHDLVDWFEPRAVLTAMYGEIGASCILKARRIPRGTL